MDKLPRIISFKRSRNPRNRIVVYATVLSLSRPTKITHVVAGEQIGKKIRLRCSCEHGSFAPRKVCKHRESVARRMKKAA